MSTRLRGDDDLVSLMNEMSSQQGYEQPAACPDPLLKTETNSDPERQRVRLTPEVNGYPSEKLAGSTMIWNPFTQVSAVPSSRCMLPPSTNPQVEVFRRRAYERFKSQFREALERISVSATAKVGPSNLWSELSVPSMMERWHFDAKLQEFLNDNEERWMPTTSNNQSSCGSTVEIKSAMEQGVMDPILISTDFKGRKRIRGEPRNKSFRSTSTLLSDEVKFEWTRTWKRIAGDKLRELDLKPIFESKRFQKKVSRLSRSVLEAATQAEESFRAQVSKRAAMKAQQSGRPFKKSSIPKILVEEDEVHVKFSGLLFRLNQEHYHKLQIMFDRMHPNTSDRTRHESAFASSLFCLLARYDMLQGAGLQASMHGSVFDVLLKHFDCRLECFASPLNSRYEKFCSAFMDTDGPFGSVGSFFDYDFARGGCYQANPPFATNFIENMHNKMDEALQTCHAPLMFVVFVPAWNETPGWNLLNESTFLTKHVSLSQSSHYYAEGTQHRRKDRYRLASFDTSVFFLQNDAARTKWIVADTGIDDLKSAFQRDPNQEEEQQIKVPAKEANADAATCSELPKKSAKRTSEQSSIEQTSTKKMKTTKRKAKGIEFSKGEKGRTRH